MNNRPSVFQIGRVDDDGHTVAITGWGLGLCVPACHCHGHPTGGGLSINQDKERALLGLVSHREGGCDCCEPWTANELAGMLRDLAAIGEIEEIVVAEVIEVIKAAEVVEVVEVPEVPEEIEGNEGVGA